MTGKKKLMPDAKIMTDIPGPYFPSSLLAISPANV